jgi:hypothetical protein
MPEKPFHNRQRAVWGKAKALCDTTMQPATAQNDSCGG